MFIRKLLLGILSFEKYLQFISYIFLKTYLFKFFLKEHYQVRFLSKLLKQDDYCIDIGANLGYFSIPLSRIVGNRGKVWSVEPVAIFRKVLEQNIKRFSLGNITVFPFALGAEDGKEILMGTPNVDGVIRHGRTEVLENNQTEMAEVHTAIMRKPKSLFGDLEKINFIKCDVEGYEIHIIPELLGIIEKFRPILEIEIDPLENKKEIIKKMLPLSYEVFIMRNGMLNSYTIDNTLFIDEIELYFIPKEKIKSFSSLIVN